MNKYEFKAWVKSKKKSYWIYLGVIATFVLIAIISLLVAMYMTGYTLASWIAEFYPILVITLSIVIIIIVAVVLAKLRKR